MWSDRKCIFNMILYMILIHTKVWGPLRSFKILAAGREGASPLRSRARIGLECHGEQQKDGESVTIPQMKQFLKEWPYAPGKKLVSWTGTGRLFLTFIAARSWVKAKKKVLRTKECPTAALNSSLKEQITFRHTAHTGKKRFLSGHVWLSQRSKTLSPQVRGRDAS